MNSWQWRLLAVVLWFVCIGTLVGVTQVSGSLLASGLLFLALLSVVFGVIAELESEDLYVGRKITTWNKVRRIPFLLRLTWLILRVAVRAKIRGYRQRRAGVKVVNYWD